MAKLLPLFPLQLVVFPGAPVPLHIFEPRYREMVGEAEGNGSEFGIVRAFAGKEENGIAKIGCTVTVESIPNRYADGRFDIVARGRRRFRIGSLNDEEDYLRAEVEFFADEAEGVSTEILRRAEEAYERVKQVLGEKFEEPDPRIEQASFRMGQAIDDLDFRSVMLQSDSETERLRFFTQFVAKWIPRREYAAHMQVKAPTNGKGHHGPGVG